MPSPDDKEECTNSTTEKCKYKSETQQEKEGGSPSPFNNNSTEDFGDLDDEMIDFDNMQGGPLDAHF